MNRGINLVMSLNASQLRSGLRSASTSIQSFSSNAQKNIAGMGSKVFGKVSEGLKGMPAQLAVAAGGAIGVSVLYDLAQGYMQFQHTLNRFRVDAAQSKETMMQLGEEAQRLGLKYGVAREGIVGAAQGIYDETGDITATLGSLELLAQAYVGGNFELNDTKQILISLNQLLKMNTDQSGEFIDMLINMGTAGTLPASKLATIFKEVAVAAKGMGVGEDGQQFNPLTGSGVLNQDELKAYMAFIQRAYTVLPSEQELATALNGMAMKLSNPTVRKNFRKMLGIDLNAITSFDARVQAVIKSLYKKTKDSPASQRAPAMKGLLQQVFGDAEGAKPFFAMIDDYAKTGELATYNTLKLASATGELKKRSDDMVSNDALTKLNRFNEMTKKLGDLLVARGTEQLMGGLQKFLDDPEQVDQLVSKVKTIGDALYYMAVGITSIFSVITDNINNIRWLAFWYDKYVAQPIDGFLGTNVQGQSQTTVPESTLKYFESNPVTSSGKPQSSKDDITKAIRDGFKTAAVNVSLSVQNQTANGRNSFMLGATQ